MPTLHWIGKDKVVNHHQEVPYRVLDHRYGFRASDTKDSSETHSGNKIIHGDNLEALKSLLPEYEGKIKCIYIDPPYNTGNEKWVYNDNVNDPKIKKWLGEVVGKQGEDLSRHDKWLCMMYPRLKLLQKLLAEDGAIFISIDDSEQANLKLLCDEIFGSKHFVGNFIWKKKQGGGADSNNLVVEHEYVVVYSKNISSLSFNPDTLRVLDDKLYPFSDEFGRYGLITLDKSSIQFSQSLVFTINDENGNAYTPRIIKGKQSCWRWSKAKVENEFEKLVFKNGKVYTKYYKPIGVTPRSLLTDPVYGRTESGNDDIKRIFGRKPFDYPKPVSLLKLLNSISTDKDSIVLDSFAGSGTTAHAVMKLNQEDGGNRKYILVEMMDYAETITAERVRRVAYGYGEIEGLGGEFDYYELGEPMFDKKKYLNEAIGEDKIRAYIYYTETKQHLERERTEASKYLLDTYNDTGYYFYYEKDSLTTLEYDTLSVVTERAGQYIIYADRCLIADEDLAAKGIIFKKIPRDIKRF